MTDIPQVPAPVQRDMVALAVEPPTYARLPVRWRHTRWPFRIGLGLIVAGLLYVALRDAPFTAIWATISRLRAWQILLLLSVNGVIYGLVTARWNPWIPGPIALALSCALLLKSPSCLSACVE